MIELQLNRNIMVGNPFDDVKKQFTGQVDQMKKQFGGDDEEKKKASHTKKGEHDKGDHDRRHHREPEHSNNPFAQIGHQFQQQGRDLQRQFTSGPNVRVQIGLPGISGGNPFGGMFHKSDPRDFNSDGKVDKSEVAAFAVAHKLKPGEERDALKEMDKNHDHRISPKELHDAAKALQGHKVTQTDTPGTLPARQGGGREIV